MHACRQNHCIRAAAGTRRGATTVEVALILPVLFLFVFASFEFSRLNMLKHLAGAAAYEGAREGIVIGATADDVTQRVNAILASGGVYDADITTTPTTITTSTTEVIVQVTIPVEGNFWVMPNYVSGSITGSCRLSTEREG